MNKVEHKTEILNMLINNLLGSKLLDKWECRTVFISNTIHSIKLQKYNFFYNAYRKADYIVCNGQVLIYASNFGGYEENIRTIITAVCKLIKYSKNLRNSLIDRAWLYFTYLNTAIGKVILEI